jgi:hypothetical protein
MNTILGHPIPVHMPSMLVQQWRASIRPPQLSCMFIITSSIGIRNDDTVVSSVNRPLYSSQFATIDGEPFLLKSHPVVSPKGRFSYLYVVVIYSIVLHQDKLYWEHERLDWDRYVEKQVHEDRFHIRYCMPLDDFEALVELLGDAIVPNIVQSNNRRCDEPIYPKMVAAIGIRVLAGGNYDDVMNTFGTSKNKYKCCNSLDIEIFLLLQWNGKRRVKASS